MFALLGLSSGLSPELQAAILSWSGGSGSTVAWNDSANWGFAGTPANGDTLIFPGGGARQTNVNNIAGLILNQIRFVGASSSYNISGSGFTLTNSLVATNNAGTHTLFTDINLGGTNLAMEVGVGVSLVLSNSLSGNATLTKIGAGTLAMSGTNANTYTNTTFVNAGILLLNKSPQIDSSLHGPLIIGDGIGGANADVVLLANGEQLKDAITPVTVNASGVFNLNGIGEFFGSLSGNGNVINVTSALFIGWDNTSTTFSGVISGSGGFQKKGLGTLTLAGPNSYLGITVVSEGTLIVDGSQPQSAVNVSSSATLGGHGTVGNITGSGGSSLSPGTSPGILTSSNVTLSLTAVFKVDLNGPTAGTDYDQLDVRGTINLASATLSVTANFTKPVGLSNEFIIIKNDGADPVIGTFTGYPNGSTFGVNGFDLKINNAGGDGNDVSFTVTKLPGATAGSAISSGNGNGIIDPNECNNLYVAITNQTGTPMTGINATLSSTTPGVVVTQPYSSYPNAPANGRSTNATAFQISTLPGFVCGSSITLNLAVTAPSHGAFTVPLLLSSGVISPSQFDVNSSNNIPDSSTIESTNLVLGITSPVVKVAVSLWITHTFVGDLNISLISPDGVIVDLSSRNGSSGDNYGIACSPSA